MNSLIIVWTVIKSKKNFIGKEFNGKVDIVDTCTWNISEITILIFQKILFLFKS